MPRAGQVGWFSEHHPVSSWLESILRLRLRQEGPRQYPAGRIKRIPQTVRRNAHARRQGFIGGDQEQNDYGDRIPWVRSIAATRWRPYTRLRSVSPRRAS